MKLISNLIGIFKKIDFIISYYLDLPTRWLDLEQACKYASVDCDTILDWINRGVIYGHNRKGLWIVDRNSIDRFYSA